MTILTKLLQKRPLATALSLFLLTNFLIQYLSPKPLFLAGITLLLVGLFALLLILSAKRQTLKPYRTAIALILSAFLLAATLGGINNAEQRRIENAYQEIEINATFKVQSIQKHEAVTVVKGKLTPDGEDTAYKTLLYFFDDTLILLENDRYLPLEEGDIFTGYFRLSAIEKGTLDELSSYADGYTLSGSYLHSAELTARNENRFSLKQTISELFEEKLSDGASSVMKSLLLADKSALSPSVKENFASLGISHLFAVSGLHLTILVGMFAHLFTRLSIGKRHRYFLLTMVILLYAVLTDFTPSLLRAGGMLLLFYLSDFIGRLRDPITALFTATTVITLISRRAILDAGLLLSFLATLGILTLGSPVLQAALRKCRTNDDMGMPRRILQKALRALVSASILTLSAVAFTMPLMLMLSGSLFLFAPLSNLIFAPLFTLILYLMPLFLITCQIPLIGGVTALLVELISSLILSLSYLALPLDFFNLSLDYRFAPYLILLIAAVSLPFLFSDRKKIALIILSSVLVFMPLGAVIDTLSLRNTESISYLSDGKNDLLFLEYQTSRLTIAFSYSDSFVKRSIDSGKLTSPSVKNDTLMLPDPTLNDTLLIYELWDHEYLEHLIVPHNHTATDALEAFAKGLGISVTRYRPNDTLVYNGIAIKTHASTTKSTYALSISLQKKTLLYIRENAPNDFDIRFGVLSEKHDILIRGAYGSDMKGSLIPFADEIWEYEQKGYIPAREGQDRHFGNRATRSKRENL